MGQGNLFWNDRNLGFPSWGIQVLVLTPGVRVQVPPRAPAQSLENSEFSRDFCCLKGVLTPTLTPTTFFGKLWNSLKQTPWTRRDSDPSHAEDTVPFTVFSCIWYSCSRKKSSGIRLIWFKSLLLRDIRTRIKSSLFSQGAFYILALSLLSGCGEKRRICKPLTQARGSGSGRRRSAGRAGSARSSRSGRGPRSF